MVRKKLKATPKAFCAHLEELLRANRTEDFANDVLSGITGKVRVPIGTILQETGLTLSLLARTLKQAGIGCRKILIDCPDSDSYKPALLAALHSESESITPIMPVRREGRHPYALSRRFISEVAHGEISHDKTLGSQRSDLARPINHVKNRRKLCLS